MVSIVNSRFHCARHGTFVVSTCQVFRKVCSSTGFASRIWYLAGALVNAWQIHSGDKVEGRGDVGVVIAAVDVETVYSVLVHALFICQAKFRLEMNGAGLTDVGRSKNGAVPVRHRNVVAISQSVRTCLCTGTKTIKTYISDMSQVVAFAVLEY